MTPVCQYSIRFHLFLNKKHIMEFLLNDTNVVKILHKLTFCFRIFIVKLCIDVLKHGLS